jgi:hypothetical protein
MGTDLSIRPVGVPVTFPVVRPAPDATTGAVQTELPAPQSTTQSAAADVANNQPQAPASQQQAPAGQPQLSQNVVIDSAANTIVYQTINQQTGAVVNQFPDDAVLQARAYYRAVEELTVERSQYDQTA